MRSQQKLIPGPVEGYKIFNDDMTCTPNGSHFQFQLGRNKLPNNNRLELCVNGFHFCPQPSGVWSYYSSGRVFKVKAYGVLDLPFQPGTDHKLCCEEIEILEEVICDDNGNTGSRNTGNGNTGNGNTGYWNTGSRNTGSRNTGNGNTGNGNTGYWNTGDGNTGYWNTGDGNTGYWNTGDGNTGNWNTGEGNTGNWNTGNGNTGNWNTGNGNTGSRNTGNGNTGNGNTGNWNTGNGNTGSRNTGNGNTGNYHSGSLNYGNAPLYLFNKLTKTKRDDVPWNLVNKLGDLLASDDEIDPIPFLAIPNATVKAIKKLHQAHIEARRKAKEHQD
jgi:hypothetical protein